MEKQNKLNFKRRGMFAKVTVLTSSPPVSIWVAILMIIVPLGVYKPLNRGLFVPLMLSHLAVMVARLYLRHPNMIFWF